MARHVSWSNDRTVPKYAVSHGSSGAIGTGSAAVQGDWIADLIVWMTAKGHNAVEPELEAQKDWKYEVQVAAEETLFARTDSWYMKVNMPGRKKQPLCYFGGVDK